MMEALIEKQIIGRGCLDEELMVIVAEELDFASSEKYPEDGPLFGLFQTADADIPRYQTYEERRAVLQEITANLSPDEETEGP